MKFRIIVNPTAGRGSGAEALPQIEQLLHTYGLDFDTVRTERPWHAAELAQEAASTGYDVAVAVGGDGTANEVLNGLMLAKQARPHTCAMGALPVGRGNDFSYGMEIPSDLESSCRALAQNHRRTIDVGHVVGGLYPKGRYFGNGIGIGFDAVVGFEAVKLTWLTGFPSYIVATLKTVFLYYRAPLTEIKYDDQAITHPSLMISIMNGQRMGGGFYMAPEGRPDDGWLDLCIAREVNRARIFGLIPHFMRGSQATRSPITMTRARHVVVTAVEGVLPAHADGETLCVTGRKLEVELLPSQLDIICQPAEATS
ncbi:MAG TPA: diacylglycerol kinase family lipid kinase [Chloroflexi bacterium]|nr:diacylglycerol kinase family lipid kinase [Chloroflexota bacterium]